MDKWRDQFTPNQYYYEAFAQLKYLMLKIDSANGIFSSFKELDQSCSKNLKQSHMNRGIGQACLQAHFNNDQTVITNTVREVSALTIEMIEKKAASGEAEKVDEFLKKLQDRIDGLDR